MHPLPEQLSTPRLRLRRPVVEDAIVLFESYTQDPEVCRFMVWKPHVSADITSQFVVSCVEAWEIGLRLPYVIACSKSTDAIGMLEARIQGTSVDIGYVLAREHWGMGFMPEAIGALSNAALARPDFFRVQATCDVENIPSQRTLEKAGFKREGRLERHTVHPNISPEPRACFMYARCR